MRNAIRRFRTSTRLAHAIGAWLTLFVLQSLICAEVSQQSAPNPERRQAEDATKRRFLAALAAYKAEQYDVAQHELESLVKSAPANFEVNELLGLVYVAQGKQSDANRFLAKAVQLKPGVAEARTALATNLLALHRENDAELQFKKAVQMEPQSYDANHNLGEFYIETGKIGSAIPFLKQAQEVNPSSYNNGYDLALALEQTERLAEAREQLQKLIALRDSAELHSLLGEVEEKSRNYVASAAQYEQAARMESSEQNILNWGAELLLHQTFAPAIEVFKAGTQRFPQSAQLQNGLGIALYGAGQIDDAAGAFFRASDLAPTNSLPLTFLGKACDGASPDIVAQIRSRLQSQMSHDSQSAQLNDDLAACLWKEGPIDSRPKLAGQIESLLRNALALDPNYSDAYFRLGNLYAEQHRYEDAVAQYDRALKLGASSANIHYRLGQALSRSGNRARAQEEFATFERLRKSETDASNQEQGQIQQFVYTIRKSDSEQQ